MCSCYAFICHAHITFRSDHIQITFICHAHSQITFICHAHINLVYSDGTCCKSSHSLPFPLRMVTCRRYQFQMTTQHTTLWHSDSSEFWCIVWVSTCRNHMSDTFIFRCHIQLCMHIHMAYSDSRFRLSFTFAMSCYIHMHIYIAVSRSHAMHTAKHILTPRINMVPLRGHGIVNLWHCVPGQYCVGGALPCLQSCLMWAWFTRPLLSIEWLVGTWKPGPVARHVTSCWKPFKFWGWDLVACVCLALLCCDCNCNMCCVTMCMWRGSECWHVCCCLLSLVLDAFPG